MPISSPVRTTVRALPPLLALALAAALLGVSAPRAAVAQSAQVRGPVAADHEVWALDQGEDVNRIHIYDSSHRPVDVIDFESDVRGPEGERLVDTPHMIDFTSDFAYAFVANTRSGNVAVIRTDDRAVLDVIPTGQTAHMAAVLPDDSAVWVANIGSRTLTEITLDLEAEVFEVGRELDLDADPAYQAVFEDPEFQPGPVCHQYTADGRYAYVTLGPAEGGLVVVDLGGEDGEPRVHTAFDPDMVRANCGVALSADGTKMYANYGLPSQTVDIPGEWYVFDTATHELVHTDSSLGGDAHGVRVTPDGSELWMVNRQSSDGIVVDTATDEVVDTFSGFGESPDILDFSPDGRLAYISLRGPNPRSGGSAVHPVAGDTPGFAVVEVASRELVEIIQPDEGNELSDVHGLGVRVILEDAGVRRVAGADRIGTAVAVSQESFGDGEAGGAVLARADDFPDALTGTPLARAVDGPVLLSPTQALPEAVADELARILPDGGQVHLLGGTAALGDDVADAVAALGLEVRRHAGATRFETAIDVAGALGDPTVQLVTTGLDFADALAAGAAAAQRGGAVLLTTPDEPHEAVAAYLAANPGEERWAVGGPAARAHPDAEPITGATRFETAVAVAEAFFDSPPAVGLARGDRFPDALAGGAHVAGLGGPLLLTPGDALHADVAAWACGRNGDVGAAFAYGGEAALADSALAALGSRLRGEGCAAPAEVAVAAARFAVSGDALVCELRST